MYGSIRAQTLFVKDTIHQLGGNINRKGRPASCVISGLARRVYQVVACIKYNEASGKLGQADKTSPPPPHIKEVPYINTRERTHRETEVLRFQSRRAQWAGLKPVGGTHPGRVGLTR